MLNAATLHGQALDRGWIAARIPHQGTMCLLDAVLAWDAGHVLCAARSHRSPANPLRQYGRLGVACGIEYAAQAMAVHGALRALSGTGGAAPRPGMLVSARAVRWHVARLDDIAADLLVQAVCDGADAHLLRYTFALRAAERLLMEGQAAVVLDVETTGARPSLPRPLHSHDHAQP